MSTNPYSKLQSNGSDFTPTLRADTYDFINPTQFDLKDKAVFVSGASKGIGRATAISFAKAGASKIAVAARGSTQDVHEALLTAASKAGRAPPQILSLKLDVTNDKSVAAAAEQIESTFGRLDICINNAAYGETFKNIAESSVDDWWRGWEVNVKGTYLVTRALLPLLLNSENGLKTIVNVSSLGAHVIMPGGSGYPAGKLAVLRLAESLCVEYGEKGLIAFGIHPGSVMTDLASSALPKEMHHMLNDTPELASDTMVWLTALRREWLRGRYVNCNWDMKQLLEKRKKIEHGDLLKVRMDVGLE
ncbi:nad-p-binding protein [Zymoseptoria brevis]|uniref:Nad-p-binding protein n=1 Tax=Zymoseptoria brevis TaxID=1047168 RepID=A0A0F4GBS5_9PEZI|nr:nad-p-binding protein [Zymoseptoria brevis]